MEERSGTPMSKVQLTPMLGCTVNNEREEFFRCFSVERNATNKELIQNDSHRPPVYWLAYTPTHTQQSTIV